MQRRERGRGKGNSRSSCEAGRKVDAAPPAVREIAWKAQHRLYLRYRALVRNGKRKTVAIVAIARELAGFIWAVARATTTARAALAN